ncbi:MAG: hypothetical protein Q7U92_22680, partial [Bradyrhizobium sp.]|nr:hypothetical protein [Bradyrhizobium sp.]
EFGRPHRHGGKRDQAGRDKNVRNPSHEFPPSNPDIRAWPLPGRRRRTGKSRITTCDETLRPWNRFD